MLNTAQITDKFSMNRREALALLAVSVPALAETTAHASIVGCWRLESSERTFTDGHKEYHWGEKPLGRIQYDKSGRMFALVTRPDRKTSLAPGMDLDTAPESELRGIVTGFSAYFGTFEIEESTQTIIHHVRAHVNPASSGTDMRRGFHFEGERLVLTRRDPTGSSSDRMVFVRELE